MVSQLKGVPMIFDDIDFMVYSMEHHEQLKQNNLFDHWNVWMFNHWIVEMGNKQTVWGDVMQI